MRQHRVIDGRFVLRSKFLFRGVWHFTYRDKITEIVRKLSTHERDKRKAEQFITDWIKKFSGNQTDTNNLERTFEQAFEEFLALKELRPTSKREYDYCFKGVYLPFFKDYLVSDITVQHIEEFLNFSKSRQIDREFKKKNGEIFRTKQTMNASVGRREKHLWMLRSFFNWAKRRKYCSINPTEGIKVSGKKEKKKRRVLNHEEASRLLNAARDTSVISIHSDDPRRKSDWEQRIKPPEHLFLAILVALHTGLRRGNITGMKWSHINFSEQTISFKAEEMKGHADHEIPIHPELMLALKNRLASLEQVPTNEFVIGRHINRFQHGFKKALKRAGLQDMRFHDLRHSVSTWYAERFPQAIKDAMLAHAPRNVSELYTHISLEKLRECVNQMPWLLKEGQPISAAQMESDKGV